MGYELGKTLSSHGSVSRGICTLDVHNNLKTITERPRIYRKNKSIVYQNRNGKTQTISPETPVSMNFWGLHPNIFSLLEDEFTHFLNENRDRDGAEFLIPSVIDNYINDKKGAVKVIPTDAQWFGVTYKKDARTVKDNLQQLVREEIYPDKLWH